MAILFGTQSNGETLPVLVDQFGNLLAKGIDGAPGPPGEPGPPGPPGVGQLPPDPFEGAVLGWEDGELAWLGEPVVLPVGTYGPYTYIPGNGQLDIPQDASSLVNGQQLYMSDEKGDPVNVKYRTDTIKSVNGNLLIFPTDNNFDKFEVGDVVQDPNGWNQSQQWSAQLTGNPYPNGGSGGGNLGFDGNLTTYGQTQDAGGTLVWTPPGGLAYTTSVRINTFGPAGGQPNAIKLNNGATVNGVAETWVTLATGSGTISSISAQYLDGNSRSGWYALEVDGNLLVDTGVSNPDAASITAIDDTVPSITVDGGSWSGSDGSGSDASSGGATFLENSWSGAGSVFVGLEGAIVLRNNNKEWVNDFYVTAPEQQIAARKVAANAQRLRKK